MRLFPDFAQRRIETQDATINAVIGGAGPGLLFLHGYPQTHHMWHRVAPRFTSTHTVVCTDLRGYGDSDKPPGDPGHQAYAKRTMALDQVRVMAAVGFERFAVVGHDRGARVAHRMCLDHPQAVTRVAVLDISPTARMFAAMDRRLALAYYHWTFLAQPPDLPERLIGADPDYFLTRTFGGLGTSVNIFNSAAMAHYRRAFRRPETIHATCEDYRAAAHIDLEHDAADQGQKVDCPVLVLWGAHGVIARLFDPLADWRAVADDVHGHAIDAGHFLAEERPDEVASALAVFLSRGTT